MAGDVAQTAVRRVEADLRRTAEDGDLVVAVTDAETRILWTYGGRVMRRKAESVNFVAGGRWDDQRWHQRARPREPARHAGDGVQRRALRADRAQLARWAAPVHDLVTGRQLGVLDLSIDLGPGRTRSGSPPPRSWRG